MDENEMKAFEYEQLLLTHIERAVQKDRAFIQQMAEMITYLRDTSRTYRTPIHQLGGRKRIMP